MLSLTAGLADRISSEAGEAVELYGSIPDLDGGPRNVFLRINEGIDWIGKE